MRIEDLERELRAERPELDPEFARKLDDWAAAGFPRGGELDRRVRGRAGSRFLGGIVDSLRTARERLTSIPPRRLVAPAGAAATLIVVGAIAITAPGGGDDESAGDDSLAVTESAPAGDRFDSQAEGAGGAAAEAPPTAPTAAPTPDVGEQAQALEADDATVEPVPPIGDDAANNISRGTDERLQDATARLRIGAPADEVQEVANDVVSVTDRHGGIVVNSEVTSDQGGARAAFELEIPFAELDSALTDLSELGDVISRTEAAEDITNQRVRAQRELANVREKIGELRIELIEADTREERLILKSQIASLEAQADAYEERINMVEREARFATVNVDVTSAGADSDEGGWGIGDAIDDAGGVLETIGGVALISLAVLVPLGLIAALAYWVITLARNASRERALDAN